MKLPGIAAVFIFFAFYLISVESGNCEAMPPIEPDAVSYDGLIIDSIIIDNRNVFDTDSAEYDNCIFRLANHLHIKTTGNTIKNELLFKVGDKYNADLVNESERNIRSMLMVYDAWIEKKIVPGGRVLLTVVTYDQWSLNGGVEYNREGNESKLKLGFEEKNLLGYNKYLSLYHTGQTDDDNFVEMKYSDKRFLNEPFSFYASFSSDPLFNITTFQLARPYYTLSQKMYFSMKYLFGDQRRDTYVDTNKVAYSVTDRNELDLSMQYRIGSRESRLTTGTSFQYIKIKETERDFLTNNPSDSLIAERHFTEDSTIYMFGGSVGYSKRSFSKLFKIDGIWFTEDFTSGIYLNLFYKHAFKANFHDFYYDHIGTIVNYNLHYHKSNFLFDSEISDWFKESSSIRKYRFFSMKYYFRSSEFLTLAFNGEFLSDKNHLLSDKLVLGGTSGIRGYNKYFKTGSKRGVINLEARFYTPIRFMSMLFGAALFTDMGAIAVEGEHLSNSHFYKSYGAGLRIGFDKSTHNIIRVDLARTEFGHWEISIATAQYFKALNYHL